MSVKSRLTGIFPAVDNRPRITNRRATTMFTNAIITGACGGLGQALAQALIARGSKVALVGLNREVLEALHAQAPERTSIYTPDVCDLTAMCNMAADWMMQHGAPDLVIANAGVAGGFDTAERDDLAVLRRMLEINIVGVANTFHPFLAAMRALAQPTALVGIGSIAGWRGMPGNGAYCASKAGLMRYLESLRAECRPSKVRVHTVSPGYLRTALTAGNRFAMPGLLEPDIAAQRLLQAVERGQAHILLPRRVAWLSRVLSLLPASWHDHILLQQPRKPRAGQAGATFIPGLDHTLERQQSTSTSSADKAAP